MVEPLLIVGAAVGYALLREKGKPTLPPPKSVEQATPEEIQQAAPEKILSCVKLDVPPYSVWFKRSDGQPSKAVAMRDAFVKEQAKDYTGKGWDIHLVQFGDTRLFYVCPPDALPPEWAAKIELLEKKKKPVHRIPRGTWPLLQKRGWTSVQPPMPSAPPGMMIAQVMPPPVYYPPGAEK